MAKKTVRALVTKVVTHGQGITVSSVFSVGRTSREVSTSFPFGNAPDLGDTIVYEIESVRGQQPVIRLVSWEPAP